MTGNATLDCRVPAAAGGARLREMKGERPRIVVLIPRGEALRNFVYSGAVRELNRLARVSVLSVTQDESTLGPFKKDVEAVLPLTYEPYQPAFQTFLNFIDLAHYHSLKTVVAKDVWARRYGEKLNGTAKLRRKAVNLGAQLLSNAPSLEYLTRCSQFLSSRATGTRTFITLLRDLQPAVVFNGSHIHSPASSRPLAAARRLGIPTAGFIFSWDNLTSRGRIKDHYDYFLVWHRRMRDELLAYYPHISQDRVLVTGTPQFDFHFKPELALDRAEICRRIGLDPARPFILYTTGVSAHFPQEHRTVEAVARFIQRITPAPQLVVRTYIKGTSEEMNSLARKNLPNVVFPPVMWKKDALTPMYEDIPMYNSLLRHCSLGINVASTVSLELMIYNKPIINLGFDPPGSHLDEWNRFERHLRLDHYRPVAESGAVMVAKSTEDMEQMIQDALSNPGRQADARQCFLRETFGDTLDGNCARRVAEALLSVARKELQA
jgi:hypothetical protein